MNLEKLETIFERQLSAEEQIRLQKIGKIFELREEDALWHLIALIEIHKDSCKKNEKEIEIILNRFSDKLSKAKIIYGDKKNITLQDLLVIILAIAVALLIYGAAAMWAGYYLGLGRPPQMSALLLMPVGYIIALSAFCPGVILMLQSAYDLAGGIEKKRGGIKAACAAICFFVASSILALTANYS